MPPSISCVVQLNSLIAIVLMSLGAALIVAAPLALLPVPTLTGVAAVTFVLGPFVNAERAALSTRSRWARSAGPRSRHSSRGWSPVWSPILPTDGSITRCSVADPSATGRP